MFTCLFLIDPSISASCTLIPCNFPIIIHILKIEPSTLENWNPIVQRTEAKEHH